MQLGQRAAAFSSEPQYCGLHIIHGVLGEVLLQFHIPIPFDFQRASPTAPSQGQAFLSAARSVEQLEV